MTVPVRNPRCEESERNFWQPDGALNAEVMATYERDSRRLRTEAIRAAVFAVLAALREQLSRLSFRL